MVTAALLLGFTVTAAVTDLLYHKIYNWTTYPGILVGITANALTYGGPGLESSLTGFFGVGLIMLVCFQLFNIGGGDVKLIAMLASFLGWERGLECMLWTFVIGGAIALSIIIWRVGLLRLLTGAIRHLYLSLRSGHWLPLTPEERRRLEPPLRLAPAALLATLLLQFDLMSGL